MNGEKGFAGASVREICKAADVSSNMIHHYFGSKQGLYDAVLERFSENVFDVPIRVISTPADTAEAIVRVHPLPEISFGSSMLGMAAGSVSGQL